MVRSPRYEGNPESDLRRQRRELVEARIKLDRRLRYGRKMWENKREPKVVMGERKRQAQVAAGKHRKLHLNHVWQAEDQLAVAETAVRDDDEVRIDLPATAVPPRKTVAVLQDVRPRFGPPVTLEVRGPERIALVGADGAGKTNVAAHHHGTAAPAHRCGAVGGPGTAAAAAVGRAGRHAHHHPRTRPA